MEKLKQKKACEGWLVAISNTIIVNLRAFISGNSGVEDAIVLSMAEISHLTLENLISSTMLPENF